MLREIYKKLAECQRCNLSKKRIAVVPGRGNPHAEIIILGEAPGLQEVTWKDEKGRSYPCPFVGKAGKNLDKFLGRAGIKREDVFITNIVKCRPTKDDLGKANRVPRSVEIKNCTYWLKSEMAALNLRLIITLGNVPLKYITGIASISTVHGQSMYYKGIPVFPMYHPAAVIYRRELLSLIDNDLKKLAQLVKNF